MGINYDLEEIRKDLKSVALNNFDNLKEESIQDELKEVEVDNPKDFLEHLTEILDSNFVNNNKHIIKKKIVRVLDSDGEIRKGLRGKKYMTYDKNPGKVKLYEANIKPLNKSKRAKILIHNQEINEFTGVVKDRYTLVNYSE